MTEHDEQLRFDAVTDTGRVREHNEDNFLVDRKLALFLVADGMGGHAAGEVASALAVRFVHEELKRERAVVEAVVEHASPTAVRAVMDLLEGAVQRAGAHIHADAEAHPERRGMGTTFSALLVAGGRAFVAHVGDSRVYLARNGRVEPITHDHTVVEELLRKGRMTREQAEKVTRKNAITRALGVYEQVDVDTLVMEVLPTDAFLLCSDGVHGYLRSQADLARVSEGDLEGAAAALVTLALERGGRDNATAIIVRLGAEGESDGKSAERLLREREVLSRMPLFARLSEQELLRVMQVVTVERAADGKVVMRQGDAGDALYIVLSGSLEVERDGKRIAELGPGEHVGEMALVRSTPRTATVRARSETELLCIARADFFEIVRMEPELSVKILWQFLGVVVERLDQTSERLEALLDGVPETARQGVSTVGGVDTPKPGPLASRGS